MPLLPECLRRLTESTCKNELKGYKVTDANRTRKFGVACRNFQELKKKACDKLNVTCDLTEVSIYLQDGSLIDEEYFDTLQPQTTLILQTPGERVLTDADLLYEILKRVNIDYLTTADRIKQFLHEHKLKHKVALLHNVLNYDNSKVNFSTKEQHPEWFDGLETNAATKEAYMHRRCQDRIRGYLYKTIDQIKSSEIYLRNQQARGQLQHAIAFFKMQLKEDHYFGYYFDRSKAKEFVPSLKEGDETDFNICYDHCPCKLNLLCDKAHFRLFGIKRVEEDENSSSNDEVDAKKMKKSHDDGDNINKDNCIFQIQQRSFQDQIAICDHTGEFQCEGIWSDEKCSYGDIHKINPYRSKEELILFSTWNLDHKIERSRSLIPRLLRIIEENRITEEDVRDIYDNLFTIKNLRLVHIVCHDKSTHK